MGNVVIKIPLVTWRDGRPRFFPGPTTKALGYRGEDLRHGPAGPWFTLDEAIAWSKARQQELACKRAAIAAGETTAKKTANAARRARDGRATISQVVETFLDSPRMQGKSIVQGRKVRPALAASTARFYRIAASCLRQFEDGQWWDEPADDLTGRVMDRLLDAIEQGHGLAVARHVRSLVSVAFKHGRSKEVRLVSHNPVADMQTTLPVLDPRVRPATIEEFDALLAMADALGFEDFADLVCAGVWTGQRQNDRLALKGDRIIDDGILFDPSKKRRSGERLLIPVAAQLAGRLEAATERRKGWKVQPLPSGFVFLRQTEMNGRKGLGVKWDGSWYGKVFRQLRHLLATGRPMHDEKTGALLPEAERVFGQRDVAAELAAAGIRPVPTIADLRDQDLRDTALSWAALAGCDKWEIAGLSGHAFGKEERVLGHYVAVPPEFARRAIAKMEIWVAARRGELAKKAGQA